MASDAYFDKGVECFRRNDFDEALQMFNEAIAKGNNDRAAYDSRAAVLERLGKPEDALKDCRMVIKVAPKSWTGYARSARLFSKIGRHDTCIKMADLALERLRPTDTRHIDELKQLRAKATKTLENQARVVLQKSIYHFGKLPMEICSSIFALAVEEHKSRVVILSHVCRHWRDVALSAPELWRSLTLTQKTKKRQVEAWIQRSRGMLFELTTKDEFFMGWRLDLAPMFSGILWERLETLSLDLTMGGKNLRESLPPDVFSRLRPINLTFVDTSSTPKQISESFWNPIDEVDFSRLRSITVSHVPNIPWNSLSRITSLRSLTLSTDTLSLSDIFPLLHSNLQLEHLALSCASRFQPSSVVPSPTEVPPSLPSLKHMSLRLANAVQYLHMCRIVAPNLRSLYIDSALQSPSYLDALLKSSEEALENLTELTFRQCILDDQVAVEILAKARRLEKLSMQGSLLEDVNAVVIALSKPPPNADLTQVSNDKLLCPRLQHIDISHHPKLQTGPIVHLIKSHMPAEDSESASTAPMSQVSSSETNDRESGDNNPILPIRTVIMDVCPNISVDALPWIRSKVEKVSCVYMTKKQVNATRVRRQ